MEKVVNAEAMSGQKSAIWKPSRYNLLVPVDGKGGALYNAFTGACIDFGEDDFQRLSAFLDRAEMDFRALGERATKLGGALLAGGFVVDAEFDELTAVKQRGDDAKEGGPLTLTINPTFACNLDCGYCFVGKKKGNMRPETEREVIKFVEGYFELHDDVPGLEIDWFGGEPLMGSGSIERLSQAFQEICRAKGVYYSAQAITNGTLLTPELADRMLTWGIDRVQISIDGVEATHNARRPWKASESVQLRVLNNESAPARSSFQDTLRGIEVAIGRFAIRARINVDRQNLEQCMVLLAMFEERGWLRREAKFYPYPSLVRDYTAASTVNWSIDDDAGTAAFNELYLRWLSALNARGLPVVKESLYGFPEPKTTPCGAVASRGWVINEDGSLHKCGFDADDDKMAVGKVGAALDPENANLKFWTGYDHFDDPTCVACRALPLCLGGCARDRREKHDRLMSEVCEFRLVYEPQILAQHIRLMRENNAAAGAGSTG